MTTTLGPGAPSVPPSPTTDGAPPPRPAARVLWLVGGLASLTPWVGPALALGAGAVLGLTLGDPLDGRSSKLSSRVLKVAVVGLGFGLSLDAVVDTGRTGVVITAIGISLTLALGLLLGRLLRVDSDTSTMVSGGTAICGGSAIAAISPALGARASSTSVALATVFILNGVALYVFPPIGHALELTQQQFGAWAAIAIHDTSSVVGAAATYGPEALELATVLKLTRALWIIPLVAGIVAWRRRRTDADTDSAPTSAPMPWFIGLFIVASGLRLLLPGAAPLFDLLEGAARQLLVLALFLVGAGLSRATLRAVGVRPLLQGVTLWLVVAAGSLAVVLTLPDLLG